MNIDRGGIDLSLSMRLADSGRVGFETCVGGLEV
jgi:hypothetical protein